MSVSVETQISAGSSGRRAAQRSTALAQRLMVPSGNHLANGGRSKSSARVGARFQSTRAASFSQKSSGSAIEA